MSLVSTCLTKFNLVQAELDDFKPEKTRKKRGKQRPKEEQTYPCNHCAFEADKKKELKLHKEDVHGLDTGVYILRVINCH